ncbi:hypothetical protein E1A91_A10G128600v1 [Gossypium mustelinum]|uniref:Phytocyanin domain-containing protein n=1 Tax=Gossypium mustelinum TaxID=34275 RepID=A0A5D2XKS9_GOSMU|nr:hypothetical protein E1A91_A10G128600v1 [Gossypium mustelinum]
MAAKRIVAQALLILMPALLRLSLAAVYKVGDSAGWTTIGNIDYKQWAATKTFQVGDVILTENFSGSTLPLPAGVIRYLH